MEVLQALQGQSRCLTIIMTDGWLAENIFIFHTEASSTDNSKSRLENDVPVSQVFLNETGGFQNPLVADADK